MIYRDHKSAPNPETETYRCKSLFAFGPLGIAIRSRRVPGSEIEQVEQDFTTIRESAPYEEQPQTSPCTLRDRGESRTTVFTCDLQLRAVCSSLAPANIGLGKR